MNTYNRFIDLEREFCQQKGIELKELRKAYKKFIKFTYEKAIDPSVTAIFIIGFGTLQFTLNITKRYVAMHEFRKDFKLRDLIFKKLDTLIAIVAKKRKNKKNRIRELAKSQQFTDHEKNKTNKDNQSSPKGEI